MRQSSLASDRSMWLVAGRLWGIALLVSGLLFGLDRIGWTGWFRGGVERVMIPLDGAVLQLTRKVLLPWQWVAAGKNATKRIADLEERLAVNAVDVSRLRELEARVQTLEALSLRVGMGKRAERIVPLLDYGDRLMIASGMRDGVQVGQVLTDSQGVLVGKIKSVGNYLSEVMLISDLGSRVAVQTQTGFSQGIVLGKGVSERADLTEVLQSEPLAVGDILVTTGMDGGYPAGLVVGQVQSLLRRPEEVTWGGEVSLLADRKGWVAVW